MDRDQFNAVLPEYIDGTIDPAMRDRVAAYLASSPDARRDHELLRSAFDALHTSGHVDVPANYFTNFLPRLRQRLDAGRAPQRVFLPEWLQRALVPMTAIVIVAVMAGLYEAMQPANTSGEIYAIVKDLDQSQYAETVRAMTLFTSEAPVVAEQRVNREIIDEDIVPAVLIDETIVSDSQILAQMDDRDIDDVIPRLSSVQ